MGRRTRCWRHIASCAAARSAPSAGASSSPRIATGSVPTAGAGRTTRWCARRTGSTGLHASARLCEPPQQ